MEQNRIGEKKELKKETSAGIIIFFNENKDPRKFLLLHYEEGHWDFPKGHVEIGETHEEAAIRETKEETGLNVNINPMFKEKISYFFRNGENLVNKDVYFFVGESKTKNVVISKEHIGYMWLSFENALKKLTFQNAKELLRKANTFLEKSL